MGKLLLLSLSTTLNVHKQESYSQNKFLNLSENNYANDDLHF